MNVKKLLACMIGIVFLLICIVGVLLLIPEKAVSTTIAIIIICCSLAIGLLIHDVTSFWGLLSGILALTIPAWIIGILFIIIGITGAVFNVLICMKEFE